MNISTAFARHWGALAFILLYVAGLVVLASTGFEVGDALVALAIFGVIFPLLAWVTTRRAVRLPAADRCSGIDLVLLAACVVALSIYLVGGPQWIDSHFPGISPRGHELINLARKLTVFVVLPFLLFRAVSGYRWRDYGVSSAALRELGRSHLLVVLTLSALFLLFNYFAGRAAAPIRAGTFTAGQLALALPLAFAWLLLEVGLVEEFFFRGVVQSRLSAWFRSETNGVALMALVFGLAHAPGFIFRRAGVVEGLGQNPSALQAMAYAIVILAPTGLVFGIVWARTRNLLAAIVIHAAVDLLPHTSKFIEAWKV